MKVGIQGNAGSYHETVALRYYGPDADIAYIDIFKNVFGALFAGKIDQAVIAIANNRYGFIPDSFSEIMARHKDITILGEAYLPVKHQLLGLPGAKLSDITEVHSQAPALGQCHTFLSTQLPHVPLVEQDDTALSAKLVADAANPTKAAVASQRAGELYGLEVLAKDIQDDQDNYTRFLVIGKSGTENHTGNKTTILLRTAQVAGSLADALQPFKQHGINISTLHSAFLPNTGFEMQFLLEFDAGSKEAWPVLDDLQKQGATVEILGSYQSAIQEMNKDESNEQSTN